MMISELRLEPLIELTSQSNFRFESPSHECNTSCRLSVRLTSPTADEKSLIHGFCKETELVRKGGLKTPDRIQILLQNDCWFIVTELTWESPARLLVQIVGQLPEIA
jgi:hypothetical protein